MGEKLCEKNDKFTIVVIMSMFGKIDHVSGAVLVRVRRLLLKAKNNPDISFLTPNLGVGGACNVSFIADYGIKSILDLREESMDNPKQIKKFGINYLRIKISDRGIPSIEDTMTSVEWLKSRLSDNDKVFIHCTLGRGRGPLLAVLYLIWEGTDKIEAIKNVKNIRRYTYLNSKQLKFISEFQNYLSER